MTGFSQMGRSGQNAIPLAKKWRAARPAAKAGAQEDIEVIDANLENGMEALISQVQEAPGSPGGLPVLG